MTSTDPAVLAAEAKVAADIAKAQADAVADAAQQTFDLNALDALVPPPAPVVVAPPPVVVTPPATTQLFPSSGAFNKLISANPTLHASNSAWQSKFASMFAAMDTSPQYGWPLVRAASSDPVYTIPGAYQTAKCHFPDGAVPSGDADGHLLILSPAGNTVTEMGAVKLTGTWPNQTVSLGNGYSPCQFDVSTATGSVTRNICGDGTVDGNTSHIGAPGSARGCGISCVAGLVTQAEFLAALAVENAGGRGSLPHALAATCSWTASTFLAPAIISDGHLAGGIPEGARIQLDPSLDVSGLPATQRVIAHTLQDRGFYVTDSTGASGNAVVFQAQVTDGTNATYTGLDEQNGNTLGTAAIWSHMRVLAAGQ